MAAGGKIDPPLPGGPPFLREAWARMKGWYQDTRNLTPPLPQVTLNMVTQEWEDLYHKLLPQG